MKKVVCAIAFLTLACCHASGQRGRLIVEEQVHEKWMDSVAGLGLADQLAAIKTRILDDTAVFIKPFYPDHILLGKVEPPPGGRVGGYAKPLVVAGDIPIDLGNNVRASRVVAFTRYLTTGHVASVIVLRGAQATAIYGYEGRGGVLYLRLRSKADRKRLRRFRLGRSR